MKICEFNEKKISHRFFNYSNDFYIYLFEKCIRIDIMKVLTS